MSYTPYIVSKSVLHTLYYDYTVSPAFKFDKSQSAFKYLKIMAWVLLGAGWTQTENRKSSVTTAGAVPELQMHLWAERAEAPV